MKVVHLLAPGSFGGVETVVRTLTVGLAREGTDVSVILILDEGSPPPPLAEALAEAGAATREIYIGHRKYRAERAAVREALREDRPDVVHTHGYRADVVDSPVARDMGIPTVVTVHGFTGEGWRGRLYEWIQRRALARFDAVVAVSRPIADRLTRSGVKTERTVVIPNAWEAPSEFLDRGAARRELGLPDSVPVIGWVGRFTQEKEPGLALKCLQATTVPELRLAMFGAGPLQAETRTLAEKLGLIDRVTWHGVVPDAHRLLRAFDALLLTSSTEGSPMVILEAMAGSVPVVATAVGGVPDLISKNEGFLDSSGDVDGLAKSLETVLNDGTLALEKAGRARSRHQREFSVGPWVQAYIRTYQSVVS